MPNDTRTAWAQTATGPLTLAEVMAEAERQAAAGETERLRPIPTGFSPLDDILNGGPRPGELLVLGGPFGVGKTIWGLQAARNAVVADPANHSLVICYEHDRTHLLERLLCLESAEQGLREEALTLRALGNLALRGGSLVTQLRRLPRYAAVLQALDAYADRLVLARASGDHTTLAVMREWAEAQLAAGARRLLVVVDYLQKVPVRASTLEPETEVTTYLTHGLKEMAMALGIQVIAIAASDRPGLKARRMRLSDLRGSSAIQYEADIGLVLNNKYAILSREHMVYNPGAAETARNWVVLSVEKNRAGRNAIDMEFQLDAVHFRIVPQGDFVRERLVDEKVTLE